MRFTPSQTRAILDRRQTMVHVIARAPRATRRSRKTGPRAEVSGKPQERVPYGPERTSLPFVPKVDLRIPFRYSAPLPNDAAAHTERAFIIVTECTDTPVALGAVTEADAQAAGHRSAAAYAEWWVRQYDKDWLARAESREREARRQAFLPRTILARFEERHASTPVWPIRFRLDDSEIPTFMLPAARGGAADDDVLAHTASPARALEPVEIFDANRVDLSWSADAEKRRVAERAEEETRRAMRSTFARARQVCIDGLKNGRDVGPVLASIDEAIAKLEERAA